MYKNWEDFTSQELLEDAYSYDRPSCIVGNALMNGFIQGGLTKKQAITLFHSKAYRWALDGKLSEMLEKVAFQYGKKMVDDYKEVEWLNDSLPDYLQNALNEHESVLNRND